MKIRTALERAVKGSQSLSQDGLNNLLKWHLLQTGAANQQQLLSRKEAILLLLTLLFYDIPPPGLLKLKPSSKCVVLNLEINYFTCTPLPPPPTATVPELYQKLSYQGVPVTAVVRLMPILQSPQIPGF